MTSSATMMTMILALLSVKILFCSGFVLISNTPHLTTSTVLMATREDRDVVESKSIYNALKKRKDDLKDMIGRRYIVRTQQGFLNVHSDPDKGPYATDNIVSILKHGQIITSTGKGKEGWIQHSEGWSISEHGGFTWLRLIDE